MLYTILHMVTRGTTNAATPTTHLVSPRHYTLLLIDMPTTRLVLLLHTLLLSDMLFLCAVPSPLVSRAMSLEVSLVEEG